jgi:hypothetical protein
MRRLWLEPARIPGIIGRSIGSQRERRKTVREARRRTRLCGILLHELKPVCKQLIINEIVVEATGVEPFIPI